MTSTPSLLHIVDHSSDDDSAGAANLGSRIDSFDAFDTENDSILSELTLFLNQLRLSPAHARSLRDLVLEMQLQEPSDLLLVTEEEASALGVPRLAFRKARLAVERLVGPTKAGTFPSSDRQALVSTNVTGSSSSLRLSKLPSLPSFKEDAPEAFLRSFEISLEASGYPVDAYPLALAAALHGPSQQWAISVKDQPWSRVRAAFLSRFVRPDRKARLRHDLITVSQKPSERARHYADRVLALATDLNLQDNDEMLLSSFQNGVLSKYRIHYALQASALTSFAAAAELLISIESIHRDNSSNLPAASVSSHRSQDTSSQTCHRCGRANHLQRNCVAQFHKDGHRLGTAENSKQDRAPKTASSTASQAPRNVTCYTCGQPGHLAPSCPQRQRSNSSAASSSTPTARVTRKTSDSQMRRVQLNDEDAELAYDSPDEDLDLEEIFQEIQASAGHFRTLKKSTATSPVKPSPASLEADVTINSHPVRAVIDTGSSHTCLSKDLALRLKLPLEKPSSFGLLKTALSSGSVEHWLATVTISSSGRQTTVEALVFESLQDDMLLGLDALPALGIEVRGIPIATHEAVTKSAPDATTSFDADKQWLEQDSHCVVETPLEPAFQQSLQADVSSLCDENTSLGPGFCSFPGAEIRIDTGDHAPVFRRQYRLPERVIPAVDEKVKLWVASGVVVPAPASSRWNSPLLAVPKRDIHGEWSQTRVCLDPRLINAITQDQKFPVPLISELFQRLAGAEAISLLDLLESYPQMLLREEDRIKTTFTWNNSRWMFKGSPFGLKNLTSDFQHIITAILEPHSSYAMAYVDDIIIFSKHKDEHVAHVCAVLETLTRLHLRLNIGKCKFGYSSVNLLGHTISGRNISPDSRKLSAFCALPLPQTGKQVESLLGCASYLRDYIPGYSTLAAPLESLRKVDDVSAVWNDKHQSSFDALKQVLSKPPVLTAPDWEHSFHIATDASAVGVGAVLYQEYNGTTHYISFTAKSLNPSQRNYPATRRELLAIVFALHKFRNYVYGSKFTLYTDHRALTYLFSQTHTNAMLNFWSEVLLEYNFDIVHRPGIEMILPDALSRLFSSFKEGGVPADSVTARVIEISTDLPSDVHTFLKDRFDKVAPPDEEREALVKSTHDAHHCGTESLIKRLWDLGYYWTGLRKMCQAITKNCASCLRHNISRSGFHPLKTIDAVYPFDHLSIDLLGPLKTSEDGNNFVIVLVDIASRFCLLKAIPDKTAVTIATFLLHTFSVFGFPKILQSDNGTEFVNELVALINNTFSVDHRRTTPYHPQANGSAEATVKQVKRLLFRLTETHSAVWDLHLPQVQLSLNTRIMTRHGSTPFAVMFARPFTEPGNSSESRLRLIPDDELSQRIETMLDIVWPALHEKTIAYNNRMKVATDDSRHIQHFTNGSKVMIRDPSKRGKSKATFSGPFTVLRQTKGGSYVLQDATGALYPSNVSPDRIKLISAAEKPSENEYEVEAVLDHRGSGSSREYLVKWKDYSAEHNTWEPAAHLENAPSVLDVYFERRHSPGSSLGESGVARLLEKKNNDAPVVKRTTLPS